MRKRAGAGVAGVELAGARFRERDRAPSPSAPAATDARRAPAGLRRAATPARDRASGRTAGSCRGSRPRRTRRRRSTIVWPSGGAFARRPSPIVPFAPARLSTIAGWPKRSVSFCAITRAEDVGAAARRIRRDDAHGRAREILCARRDRKPRSAQREQPTMLRAASIWSSTESDSVRPELGADAPESKDARYHGRAGPTSSGRRRDRSGEICTRRSVLAATAAVLWMAQSAFAQTYPVRSVRLIVPYPPGGATDIISRSIAHQALGVARPAVHRRQSRRRRTEDRHRASRRNRPRTATRCCSCRVTHSINPRLDPKLPYDSVRTSRPSRSSPRAPTWSSCIRRFPPPA